MGIELIIDIKVNQLFRRQKDDDAVKLEGDY